MRFIVLEGGDGSGKGTQAKLLVKHFENAGKAVMNLSFPRYGKHSAETAAKYLRGEFGEANAVPAELASLAYALDRASAKYDVEDFLHEHPDGIIICDRYVASNLAHQGVKIDDKEARKQFYANIMELEYGDLRLPKPDKNVILLVPANIAQQNVDKKAVRTYTKAKRDVHEADSDHLSKALRNYQEVAELYPDQFVVIWAVDKKTGHMRPIKDIHKDIVRILV